MSSLWPPKLKSAQRQTALEARRMRLFCPDCGYGHFMRDIVARGIQTVVCAQCAARWYLGFLQTLADAGRD